MNVYCFKDLFPSIFDSNFIVIISVTITDAAQCVFFHKARRDLRIFDYSG